MTTPAPYLLRLGEPTTWYDAPLLLVPWLVRLSPWATWSRIIVIGLN